jgi:hypothetical protein
LLSLFPCTIDIADVSQSISESAEAGGRSLLVADFVPVLDGFPVGVNGLVQSFGAEVRIGEAIQDEAHADFVIGIAMDFQDILEVV